MAKISLVLDQSHSLKEKRMVLRRIKDRVRERANVVLSEVGAQDIWQRAELGCAGVSNSIAVALSPWFTALAKRAIPLVALKR